jgi:hypothetical protein
MSSATPEYSVGKTVLLILGLSFIQFVIPLVFNFMDIDAKYYQVYIYWCMALVIFYIALPSVVGEYIFLLPAAKAATQAAAVATPTKGAKGVTAARGAKPVIHRVKRVKPSGESP